MSREKWHQRIDDTRESLEKAGRYVARRKKLAIAAGILFVGGAYKASQMEIGMNTQSVGVHAFNEDGSGIHVKIDRAPLNNQLYTSFSAFESCSSRFFNAKPVPIDHGMQDMDRITVWENGGVIFDKKQRVPCSVTRLHFR